MEGISKERLKELRNKPHQDKETVGTLDWLIAAHCKELQEPWILLEEFLNKPRYEWHWIMLKDKQIHMSYVSYNDSENYVFYCNDFDRDESYSITQITHVMPIHKPEPPR